MWAVVAEPLRADFEDAPFPSGKQRLLHSRHGLEGLGEKTNAHRKD